MTGNREPLGLSIPHERPKGKESDAVGRSLGDRWLDRGGPLEDLQQRRAQTRQFLQMDRRQSREMTLGRLRQAEQHFAAVPRVVGPHDQPGSTTQSNTQSDTEKSSKSAQFRPGGTVKLNRDDAILEILAAVKDGRLEPDEADDLINAWMEVSRGDDVRH